MTHPHPTPDPVFILYHDASTTVSLHQDAAYLALALAWTLIGTSIYLSAHGLAPSPKQLLTLFCGPGAWILSVYKNTHLRHERMKSRKPPILKHWEMPHQRN